MTGIAYASREDVKLALDIKLTARMNAQVDRALDGGSRSVEGLLHRCFYPWTGTRYFDWPESQGSRSGRLWLGQNELISLSALASGGVTIAPADYFLEPSIFGPPYDRIDINRAGSATFGGGSTAQRSISATGVFGYNLDEAAAGALSAAVVSTSATTINVTDASLIGVGNVLRVDTERVVVTERSSLTTGQTLQTPMTANPGNAGVVVTDGTAYQVGEVLTLDTERMLVVDVTGNTVIVKRAWDGSTLAAHAGSTIYADRALTVTRGALGTTAATHLISAPLYRQLYPGLVTQLAIAEACNTLEQQLSGYSGEAGGEGNRRSVSGAGLKSLREQAVSAYGRRGRMWAV